jgi:hypothetical protein
MKEDNKRAKATDAEMLTRIKEVAQLQLDGYNRSEIIEYCNDKWGIQRASSDNLIALATARIKEINEQTVQETLAMICSNYWEQFRIAKAAKNGSLCVTILEKIAKLKGLEQYTVNHVVKDERDLETMSDEELDKILMQDSIQ